MRMLNDLFTYGGLWVLVQVIIQGFRSYRDQTVVDPFSPKHNVIGVYVLDFNCPLMFFCVIYLF